MHSSDAHMASAADPAEQSCIVRTSTWGWRYHSRVAGKPCRKKKKTVEQMVRATMNEAESASLKAKYIIMKQ